MAGLRGRKSDRTMIQNSRFKIEDGAIGTETFENR